MPAVQLYSASAGSGKTFTLVREYLAILFEKARMGNYRAFRGILAITFTNKATEEMKERVINALKEIAAGTESDLLRSLKENLPGHPDYRKLADRILRELLRDYSSFNVQTIDSFFQDIIRSFARELQLPLNYEVELKNDDAREFAVNELISRVGFDDELTAWLQDYAFSRISEDKGWNFRGQLTEFSVELFDESLDRDRLQATAENMKAIRRELNAITAQWEKSVAEEGEAIWKEVERCGVSVDACNKNWVQNIRKSMNGGRGFGSINTFLSLLSGEKSVLTKTGIKEHNLDENALVTAGMRQHSIALHRLLTEDILLYNTASLARRNIHAVGVIHQLNIYLNQYRRENNVLFIIDAARLIEGFIQLEEMPFLFEKIGSRIEYLFIDEFQDTSTGQWNNMLPLILNILAASGDKPSVMLVGDAKQSIYRWRGGDYSLITGGAAASIRPFESETVELDTNFRSLPEIVEFNNRFFTSVMAVAEAHAPAALREEILKTYAHVRQKASKTTPPGKVGVRIAGSNDDDWKAEALAAMDKEILALTEAGYAYHDIAILVKRRKDGVEISRHLQDAGIEVLSAETLLLKFDPEIKLIIAALYYIHEPGIDLHYVNLLWQFAKVHPGRCGEIRKAEIFEDHRERRLVGQWMPNLKDEIDSLAAMGSYQALERVCAILSIDSTASLFTGHLRQAAFEFFSNRSTALPELLEWWEAQKDELSVNPESGTGRINVMTIHKSKGLEFPAVLIPYCDWNVYNMLHADFLWLSDPGIGGSSQLPYPIVSDLENSIFREAYESERRGRWVDTVNVLYVALTRAREYLSLTLKPGALSPDLPSSASKLVRMVLDGWEDVDEEDGILFQSGELKRPDTAQEPMMRTEPMRITPSVAENSRLLQDLPLQSGYDDQDTRVGKLVHDSVYFADSCAPGAAVKRAAGKHGGTTEEIAEVNRHLDNVSGMERYNRWLVDARQVWSEQDIWHRGKLYRPDKIIRMQDSSMIVIDYKTGEPKDANRKQVAEYMEAIRTIHPGLTVEGFILYTNTGQLEEVDLPADRR